MLLLLFLHLLSVSGNTLARTVQQVRAGAPCTGRVTNAALVAGFLGFRVNRGGSGLRRTGGSGSRYREDTVLRVPGDLARRVPHGPQSSLSAGCAKTGRPLKMACPKTALFLVLPLSQAAKFPTTLLGLHISPRSVTALSLQCKDGY